jgi:cytochrome c biogenesis protein CcmG, thiol:disulfide interchange protein DsbE
MPISVEQPRFHLLVMCGRSLVAFGAARDFGRTSLALALFLAATGCAPDVERFRPLQAGDAAPEFAAPTLGGDTVSLVALRGSPVLLNVWATWCPPCREEMPALQALHETFGDRGLRVIGVSIDARGAESAIRSFADDHGIRFTLLHDPAEAVSRQFRINGVPETFLIDGAGRIVRRWIGAFDPAAADVAEQIEAALAG